MMIEGEAIGGTYVYISIKFKNNKKIIFHEITTI